MKPTTGAKKNAVSPAPSSRPGPQNFRVASVEIDSVVIEDRKRVLSAEKVSDLVASILTVGLTQPIVVTASRRLVAGAHRLAACRQVGLRTIQAVIVPDEKLLNEQREIDENLVRSPLTVLERCEHHRRARELYLETQAADGSGGRNNFADAPHYTEAAAERSNVSRRSVQQEIRIDTLLGPEVKELIRNTPIADRKNDLLSLTRFSQERQLELARLIHAGAKTLRAALRAHAERGEPGGGPQTSPCEEAQAIRNLLKLASAGFTLEDIPDPEEARALVQEHEGFKTNILRTLDSIITRYQPGLRDAHATHSKQEDFVAETRPPAISAPGKIQINTEGGEGLNAQPLPLFRDQPAT